MFFHIQAVHEARCLLHALLPFFLLLQVVKPGKQKHAYKKVNLFGY